LISKLLLNRPERVLKVEILIPKGKAAEAIYALGRLEGIHVEQAAEAELTELKKRAERTKSVLEAAKSLLLKSGRTHLDASLSQLELESLTLEKIEEDVFALLERVSDLESKAKLAGERAKKLAQLAEALAMVQTEVHPSFIFHSGRVYSARLASGRGEVLEKLGGALEKLGATPIILGCKDGACSLSIIYPSSAKNDLIAALEMHGLYYVPDDVGQVASEHSSLRDLLERVQAEREKSLREYEDLNREIRSLVSSSLEWLGKYYLFLENQLSHIAELEKLLSMRHLVVLRGWTPQGTEREISAALEAAGIPHYMVTSLPSPSDSPPTKLNNVRGVRNFEVITELYGLPNYWEWDPTPLVAYSFAAFFGLMVADAGYSLLGSILIYLLLDRFVVDKNSPAYKKFKRVLYTSNAVALLFGLATGAFLGNFLQEFLGLNIPVLIKWMLSPLSFIKVSLLIGLAHINVAHLLALVKSLRMRDIPAVMQEVGIFGVQVFGIPLVLEAFFGYSVPVVGNLPRVLLLGGSIAMIALIVASSVLAMRLLGLMMWIFQLTGILGDVLSYVRLAGVGLATYYLAYSFNFMAKMIMGWAAGSGSVLVYVGGALAGFMIIAVAHLIGLALSILGGFVHSLRLCFLEFLSKFYSGDGSPFSPLRIVMSKRIVLG